MRLLRAGWGEHRVPCRPGGQPRTGCGPEDGPHVTGTVHAARQVGTAVSAFSSGCQLTRSLLLGDSAPTPALRLGLLSFPVSSGCVEGPGPRAPDSQAEFRGLLLPGCMGLGVCLASPKAWGAQPGLLARGSLRRFAHTGQSGALEGRSGSKTV